MLIVCGDHDFVRVEHTVASTRLIADAELAVIPDAGHFALHSEPDRVIPIVKHFMEKPEKRSPLAPTESGYLPGETRCSANVRGRRYAAAMTGIGNVLSGSRGAARKSTRLNSSH